MSDFTSGFWSFFIIAVTLGGIFGCAWLLWANSIKKADKVDVTGHTWDETLAEYDNALPSWWIWMFYATIVFSLAYLVVYPGLGTWKGTFGWCTAAYEGCEASEYAREVKKAEETYGPKFNKYLAMDVKAVSADPEAKAMGQRLFLTYCAQCHGADAKGSAGFPNLADNDWLGAGDAEYIKGVITSGRIGAMPPLGEVLSNDEIKDVAHYVRSLSDLAADSVRVPRGKEIFAGKGTCFACHGADAKGNPAIGAPNLTDKVWLYSSSEASIIETIAKGRNNAMPAQEGVLGASANAKAHLLAAYVLGLPSSEAAGKK